MGAVASVRCASLTPEVVAALGHFASIVIEQVTVREAEEVRRREEQYRGARPFPELEGRTVILVDDGLATGATMRAAARAVRAREPYRLIIAVPVAPQSSCEEMRSEADGGRVRIHSGAILWSGTVLLRFPTDDGRRSAGAARALEDRRSIRLTTRGIAKLLTIGWAPGIELKSDETLSRFPHLLDRAPAPAGLQRLRHPPGFCQISLRPGDGVAVSQSGRVFVNFPNWSEHHGISVAEIVDGKLVPFPNEEWNQAGTPNNHFVCVQSVYVG